MPLSTAQKLQNLGMASETAIELGRQIDTGVYNWRRLMWTSMPPDLSRYVATSLAQANFSPKKAGEYGMVGPIASLVYTAGMKFLATVSSYKTFLASTSGSPNPHSQAVAPSPPTITAGTTLSGLGAANLTQVVTLLDSPNSFRSTGGGVLWVTTNQRAFPVMTRVSGGNTTDPTLDNGCWLVGAQVNAQKVAIQVTGSTTELYRFLVDGRYVSLAGTAVGTGGAPTYALLDFGSKASRYVEVECGSTTDGRPGARRIVSFSIDPADTISGPAPINFPILYFGDSFTAATGATFAGDCYASVASDYLGQRNRWMSGAGGTGYVATGDATKYNLPGRIVPDTQRMVAISSPKVVCIAMGINDPTPAGMLDPAIYCVDYVRQACADALIFVVGVWDVLAPSAPGQTYLDKKAVLQQAIGNRGGVYFVDMQGVSFTKIVDNVHPDDAGHRTLGLSVDSKIRAIVGAL